MEFATETFREGLEALLAAVAGGAADLGEVVETAARVQDGDADSWLREWTAAGGAAWAAATRRPSARRYLHAATYYAAPLELIAATDGSVSETALRIRQRTCWERAVGLLGGVPLRIPYEDRTLPGAFFRGGRGRRPLVVVDHGGREQASRAWLRAGAAAHDRGYHWMTFDGPGRQAVMRRAGPALRPDWEAVITPVVDAMLARPDVDPARLAIVGVGEASYGVVRALAFEHRLTAAVADPGVLDLAAPWTAALAPEARAALRTGDRRVFDRELHLAGLFDPQAEATLRRRARWYGVGGHTPFDVYARIGQFRLGAEIERITTPILVREDPRERHWSGQARRLHARLPGPDHELSDRDPIAWLARALTA